MQTPTRVLLKLNIDRLRNYPHMSCFGAEPKIATGYDKGAFVAIPIKFLLRDGFSFPDMEPEWYEKGTLLINSEPCYLFRWSEVDILTS